MSRKRWTRSAVTAVTTAALGLAMLNAPQAAFAQDTPTDPLAGITFVDCQATGTSDGTVNAPLNTLDAVNALALGPGDQVLFKRGSVCDGVLKPQGSGAAGAPIVIDAYGDAEAKPQIRGGGVSATVELFNQEYWELRNLDISNIDADPAQQYKNERRGVVIKLKDFGQGDYYRLVGLDIHDVYGQGKKDLGGSGGIQLEVYADSDNAKRVKTWFNDVLIEGNSVINANRSGINMSTAWKCRYEAGWDGCGGADRTNLPWVPSTGLVIRGNTVKNIGGDGIVVQMNRDALVEYNTVSDVANRRNGSNAGVWAWNADGTLFQYNEVFDVKRLSDNNDGNAFDSDYGSTETVFQYNYSHDNEGGMMLFCGCVGITTKVTFRYNVSENDLGRTNFVAGATEAAYYNNTILMPDVAGVLFNQMTTAGTSALFANNLIVSKQAMRDESTNSPRNVIDFRNNAFAGPGEWPAGTDNVTIVDTITAAAGTGAERFKIDNAQLRGAGLRIAPEGTNDIFGTAVPTTCAPDIGAYQTPKANDCQPASRTIAAGATAADVQVTAMQTLQVSSATGVISVTNPNGFTTPADARGNVTFVTTMDATSVTINCASGADCTDVTIREVQNLIVDPSFEATSNAQWSDWNTARGTVAPVSGKRTLTIAAAAGGSGSGEQTVKYLLPNTDYTISGWVSAPGGSPVRLGFKNFTGNPVPGNTTQKEKWSEATSPSATHQSVSFNSGSDSLIYVYCYRPSGSGTATCDDITLTADASQAGVVASPVDTTVREGSTAAFMARFSGVDRPEVRWEESIAGAWSELDGVRGHSLSINALTTADSGRQFRAVVHGPTGAVATAPATVTVLPALAAAGVDAQPEATSVVEGAIASFTTTATGYPAPSITWERRTGAGEWTPAVSAAARAVSSEGTLNLAGLTVADTGVEVRAVVTNAFGSVTTAPASVTVTAAPGTGEPGTGEPGTGEPGTGEPGTEEPGTGEPGTGNPGTEEPGTGNPGTEEPGTETPVAPIAPGGKPGTDAQADGGALPATGSELPIALAGFALLSLLAGAALMTRRRRGVSAE